MLRPGTKRLLLLAALLCHGCTVGPDFVRPAAPAVGSYTAAPLPEETASADVGGGHAQRFVRERDVPGEWWESFGSHDLDRLIEQALAANPNLQAAQAALRVAQENVRAQRGAFFPSVSASYMPSREKTAATLASVPSSGAYVFGLQTAQVSVSFVPDVFGGNRRLVESLEALADQQRFALAAAHVTLASNIVAAAVQAASLRGQIAALEQIIALQSEQLAIMRRQLELGEIAESSVIAQAAALAQARAQVPALRKQLAAEDDAIAALCGRTPGDGPVPAFTLADLSLPEDLPLSLPSRLVEQRPDVRAAEAGIHAASAQVGVAVANMLPQFTIDAAIGSTAARIADLFKSGTGFWSVGGDVAQPLFQGGTLVHRKRAAEAALDEAQAQYRAAVLTAFQNVADTLQALSADADALRAAVDAERSARESVDISQRQIELGDTSPLALLLAQQAYEQALINRIQAQANRFADTAALFQALGGGWSPRDGSLAMGQRVHDRDPSTDP